MKYNDLKIQNEVSQAIQNYYGFNVSSIEFIPVGEESYAYAISTDQGQKYFVKYCEQAEVIKNIAIVNSLLIQLRHLPFVVAPIEAHGDTAFNILNGKMYVYAYIEGEVVRMGNGKFNKELVEELTKIMSAIHNSAPSVDLPEESFRNAFSARFEKLLTLATDGVLESDVKQLLLNNKEVINELIQKHDAISMKYLAEKPRFVLTHGDITGLNLIMSKDGIKLVDWDGAMFAPAERDINFLFDNPHFSIDDYFALTNRSHFEPDLKDYYGQDWALNSIIGNFESILNDGTAKGDKNEYIEEINEYLGYYK